MGRDFLMMGRRGRNSVRAKELTCFRMMETVFAGISAGCLYIYVLLVVSLLAPLSRMQRRL